MLFEFTRFHIGRYVTWFHNLRKVRHHKGAKFLVFFSSRSLKMREWEEIKTKYFATKPRLWSGRFFQTLCAFQNVPTLSNGAMYFIIFSNSCTNSLSFLDSYLASFEFIQIFLCLFFSFGFIDWFQIHIGPKYLEHISSRSLKKTCHQRKLRLPSVYFSIFWMIIFTVI